MSEVAHAKPRRLRQLEDRISEALDTVDDNWRRIAKDLVEIRDKKMHHDAGYDDWYQYVQDTFNGRITRGRIENLVGAYDVAESISKGINNLDQARRRASADALKNKVSPSTLAELRDPKLGDKARAEIFSSALEAAKAEGKDLPSQRDVRGFVKAHYPDQQHAKTRQRVRRLVEELVDASREITPAQFVKSMRAGNGDPAVESALKTGIPPVVKYLNNIKERIDQ